MAAVLKLKRHQKGQKSLNMKASSKKQISNPCSSSGAEFIGLRLQPELKARESDSLITFRSTEHRTKRAGGIWRSFDFCSSDMSGKIIARLGPMAIRQRNECREKEGRSNVCVCVCVRVRKERASAPRKKERRRRRAPSEGGAQLKTRAESERAPRRQRVQRVRRRVAANFCRRKMA
jgi:hypothetical protein